MPKEIERKFLADFSKTNNHNIITSKVITQAYLSTDPQKTIRVRIADTTGFLTIKSKGNGISRDEYEYEIPLQDAQEMIEKLGSMAIYKTRHIIHYQGFDWEVDVFEKDNSGLCVAEIELPDESTPFETPDFIIKDVTFDYRYSNSQLSKKPFTTWSDEEKAQ